MEVIDNVRMQELALRSAVACRCRRAYLHDVRGGLQSIASSFELLTRAAHAAPFNQALAAKAAEFFRRAVDSHEQVLDESFAQICGREPEKSAVELESLCGSALKFLQNDAAARRVALQPAEMEPVVVQADAGSLRLLALALLTHAIDHAAAGASVRVAVERLPRVRVVFIAPQWAADGEGFGLIRSVGSRLMMADGGAFGAEGAAPERVSLDMVSAAEQTRPIRILYVEDNPLIREMTCELLLRPEREIAAFATAEDALHEFQQRPYDLVITDVSLPHMSGLDLARRIARTHPRTAIIIATGYEMPTALDGWEGNAALINKPFEADDVEPLIRRLLESANSP